jgi:hypothetical protein
VNCEYASPAAGWSYSQACTLAAWLETLGYRASATPLASSRADYGVLVTAPRLGAVPPTVIRGPAELWRVLPRFRPTLYKLAAGAN